MPHKNSKEALYADNRPNECLKLASPKVKEFNESLS